MTTLESRADLRIDGNSSAVGELVDIGHGNRVARLDAAHDLDSIAETLADLQLAGREVVAVDHEDAVDAVAVLDR